MNVTIVSVGPCRVIDLHRVREEANGVEFIMLVDNGREYVVWRVHQVYDDSYPAGHAAAVDKFHAFNGNYYPYDRLAEARQTYAARAQMRDDDLLTAVLVADEQRRERV